MKVMDLQRKLKPQQHGAGVYIRVRVGDEWIEARCEELYHFFLRNVDADIVMLEGTETRRYSAV